MDSFDIGHVPPPNPEFFWPFEANQERTVVIEPLCILKFVLAENDRVWVQLKLSTLKSPVEDWLNLNRPCVALRTREGEPLVTFTLRVVDPTAQTMSLQVTVNPRYKVGSTQ